MPSLPIIGVYEIRCLIDQKVYIGQSKNIRVRWLQHRWCLSVGRHRNPHLQAAWNKYGESSFLFSVLQLCSLEDLSRIEERLIWETKVLESEHGYNLEIVKDGVSSPSLETRIKIGLGNKGKTVSPESRARISAALRVALRGRVLSPETIEKMRLAGHLGKGKKKPEGFGAKISKIQLGRKKSQEEREHISQAKKGKPLSPKALERNRVVIDQLHKDRIGKHLSEETRKKIGAKNLGRVQSPEERKQKSLALKGRRKTPEHIAAAVEGKRRARIERERLEQ